MTQPLAQRLKSKLEGQNIPNLSGFDHPCKDTCSGWTQGWEIGIRTESKRLEKVHAALVSDVVPALEQMPCRKELASAYSQCCLRCDALAKLKAAMGDEWEYG